MPICTMKRIYLFIPAILALNACTPSADSGSEDGPVPKTGVEVAHIRRGSVSDDLELSANTIYLKRNMVTSPIPAFITRVNVRLGDYVNRGDILFELESKERRALGSKVSALDTAFADFGIIRVKAQASGVVSTLDKQQTGDYVLEGALLCTIAESNDLAFQINVPYEFTQYVKPGQSCRVVLPDNSVHDAVISTPLSTMNLAAQTQSIQAKSSEKLFLPENLIVKVLVSKGTETDKQILPKTCVQSDEMMQEFWVMKLLNDSMAVKVSVSTGNQNETDVEILSPQFGADDRIVASGSYGLPDTAWVKIVK